MPSVMCLRLSDVRALSATLFIFSFQFGSAFLSAARLHSDVGLRNMGHLTLPKIWVMISNRY